MTVNDTQIENSLTWDELIDELQKILDVPKHLRPAEIDHAKLQSLMDRYKSDRKDWGKYALQESHKGYTRNGVINFGDNANLLILVWNPKKGSAIHDHAGAHCIMKILDGSLQEELFDNPRIKGQGNEVVCYDKHPMNKNQSRYINDLIGVHRVTNVGTVPAVSLHLYTPPYAKLYGCNIYTQDDGHSSHVDMSRLYSWQGKVINNKSYSTC
ncbi:cysteine dioxygenase [Brettanomyces bruxellensis AWRI1499]|uniref:Cysteine dioxygenase n=1 Tax=Dekkera bruxellensis TaxID=5007 RepID=A0A871RHC3_DEKBR|nr:uncharacterized protein BRETT_001995 [Brettanomyces bruxellensis]EIF49519.1 cysteine dioxygenase [Brettanomyces bruxellensis AWRI1499]QOU21831.1 hypothetical protein BRETT_001995 [Brettanomyces bruxellensis]